MKTTKKIILSITLVAITTASFAQLSTIRDRILNRQNNQVAYITADYKSNETSRIESWMTDLRTWANTRVVRETYEAPVVIETLVVEDVDVIFEEVQGIENWMTTPFNSSVAEEALTIENWMTTPFNSSVAEEALPIENWMTAPFEAGEYVEVEAWMAKSWI